MAKPKKALEEMTKDELVKEAKKQKVTVSSKANKAQIIEAIKAATTPPVTEPVVSPEVTEPTVTAPVVGVAPLQQGVVTNGANEVFGNTAIPVSEVNEIWESEERKRRRLENDPSLRAM